MASMTGTFHSLNVREILNRRNLKLLRIYRSTDFIAAERQYLLSFQIKLKIRILIIMHLYLLFKIQYLLTQVFV